MAELMKKDHEGIARILSKEQSAVLAKLVVRRTLLGSLDMTLYADTPGVKGRAGLLQQIKISPAQWKELCRLHDEKDLLIWRFYCAIGEGVLKILSPEQQEKFIAEWSRTFANPPPQASPTKGDKNGMTIVAMGTLTLQRPGGKDATKAARGPKGPPRILPPKTDAAAAGAEAIRLYDADHDGKLSGEELDKCPGLKAAIDNIDRSGNGEITAEKITARIRAWQDSRLARMSLGCRVTHNGVPLAGAEVKFVPEKFLGENLKTATGKTDANGLAMIATPESGPPGVAPGFYRVEITKAGEDIPAKYNTETIFGQEVAVDAKGVREGIRFDLKY